MVTPSRSIVVLVSALGIATPSAAAGLAEQYRPADQGQRPAGPRILPEKLLRGFDPITAYFDADVGPGHGPADAGGRVLKIAPAWPGAWSWLDRRTLQFRPSEPWPALTRFDVEARGIKASLSTMMAAPSQTSPASGSENLAPFRMFSITFPQPMSERALKGMLKMELRDLPGLGDSLARPLRGFAIAALPRSSQRDPATYAVTLDEEVGEGKQLRIDISLALGDEGRVLWTGRLSTRLPFHLRTLACGAARLDVVGLKKSPKEMALSCGNSGETPQLVFSAPLKELTLGLLKRLVRLEPAVPDMTFAVAGSRVMLRGHFRPDVLYRMELGAAPITDDSGRLLRDPGPTEAYFYLGWKSPFLRWSQSNVLMEANGPRMVPLVGYSDPRADLRIYRIDPLSYDLWPFPQSPLTVNEESAPPFPGEEPQNQKQVATGDSGALAAHIRLLGSPLVSQVVELPLGNKSVSTHFGLEIGSLLDRAVGKNRPGTYLVGLRRLAGPPERSYVRVQITNLSLTVAEETSRAVFFVRTLDRGEPVAGARILLEITRKQGAQAGQVSQAGPERSEQVTLLTDSRGQAVLGVPSGWTALRRVSVSHGEDTLVIGPHEPPPRFFSNHWSVHSSWLAWLCNPPKAPINDKQLAFLITERPIYRPGETVFLKGWVRHKVRGELRGPAVAANYGLRIQGPENTITSLPVKLTALGGFSAELQETKGATGDYTATFYQRTPEQVLAVRHFKIEAYRLPTFEVQLSSAPRVRLDAPFKVKALARYYAGGHLSGQPVAWMVRRRPYHHVPAGHPGYIFGDSNQFARPGAVRPPDTMTRNKTLDTSGADEIEVNPALDVDGSPRVYHVAATVTGPDDQQVSAVTEVLALPPFALGLKLPRLLEKATEIKPEIIAVGVDDRLVADESITVRLYRRVWHNQLRETPFATGKARYVTEQQDTKLIEKTIRSETRPVSLSLPIKDAGVYVVELVARDKLGRVQTVSADLYAGGAGAVAWPKSREGVISLTPDARSYKPGSTARIVVQSPFQTGKALSVVEEPGGNQYAWHEVSGGKAIIAVKTGAHHVPNLPVHVILMRGRIGTGEADDSRYRPQSVAASVDLTVEPVRNQIAIEIRHPETVRPGQKVEFQVSLSDESKRPLAGELTFWLVDESVLSLAREETLDPLSAMIERNQRITSLRDTRNLVIGRILEQDEQPGGDGGDKDEEFGKAVVRKNFKTVPFYQATIEVGPSGKVTIPVTMSDDLTNFKVRAVAVSGMTRFGFRQTTVRTRLPLLVQPQLPRFVRQGDRVWAGGVVRLLEGADGDATVVLKLSGPVDAPGARKTIALKKGLAESHLFPVTIQSTDAQSARMLAVRVGVTRTQGSDADAFEVKIPVLPDRTVERFAYYDRLKPGPVALRAFPEAPRAGTASQDILVTNETGLLELAAGLAYLGEYPHGCLEQKLSVLGSTLTFSAMLKQLGLDDRAAAAAVGAKRLVEELPQYQDTQGFFAYWPGGAGDVALTAQVAAFLGNADKHGLRVDSKLRERTLEALKRTLRSDFGGLVAGFQWNQRSAALRALAEAGFIDESYMLTLFHHRAEMDLTSLADLGIAMSTRPKLFASNLGIIRDDLWNSLLTKLYRGNVVLEGLRWRRADWSHGYLGSHTSTLAAVFESLLWLAPEDKRLPLLRDALLSRAPAEGGFGSTHDNRRALAALALYLERAPGGGASARLTINGRAGDLSVGPGHKIARATVAGEKSMTGTLAGAEVGARVAYSYLPAAPGADAPALRHGLLVQRSATRIEADGSSPTRFEDKAGSTARLKVGDVLELHTQLTTEQARSQLALVVPFAAGLELLNESLANVGEIARTAQSDSLRPTYVQRLDQEVRYYFDELPRGTHSFHFRVRAVSQGRFVHPAPWAEQMYHQEVRGRGEGMRIVVTGPQQE